MTSKQRELIAERVGFEAMVRNPCELGRFAKEPVPRADIEHMVGVATGAMTLCDSQAWRFIAIEDRKLIDEMQQVVLERFEELALRPGLALQEQQRMIVRAQALLFGKAPLCIAVLALSSGSPAERLMELAGMSLEEHERICVRPELQSAGAAVQLLAISAHSLGYSVCWSCSAVIAGERLEELLRVAPPSRLAALVPIGRPAGAPASHVRRPTLQNVLSFRS